MALYRDNEACAPLINDLSLRTTTALMGAVDTLLKAGLPQSVAVTIAYDAVLMSAISLLKTAVNNDMIGLTVPFDQALHDRLNQLLQLEFRMHSQRTDGSFDPAGRAMS